MNLGAESAAGGELAADASDRPRVSLRQLVLRGSLWTTGGHVAGQTLRLAGNLVLTRMLFPEAFGVMALVGVINFGLEMFSDVGLASAVVRDERGEDPVFLDTAWTMRIIRGFVLWLGACLLAVPAADFFGEPTLRAILPVASASAVIAGFTSTKMFTQRRHLALGRLAVIEVAARGVALVVMVAWVLAWQSVWGLVAGGLVSGAVRLVLSHVALPGHSDRIRWDPTAARSLFHFGKWIALSSALYFLARQGDRLLLGHYVDSALLGVYSVAVLFTEAGLAFVTRLIRSVLYPSYAKVQRDDIRRLGGVYYRTRRVLDATVLLPLAAFAALAVPVVALLYDPRYHEAGAMLQILLVRLATSAVSINAECCLVALGHPRYAFVSHLARTAWILLGIPLGWHLAGMIGVLWATTLSEFPVLVVLWWGFRREGLLEVVRELPSVLLLALLTVLALLL